MKIYLATSNEGKIREIKTALADSAVELTPIDIDLDEIEEEMKLKGVTNMEEISKAKALKAYHKIRERGLENNPIIVDDAGIYIEGTDGPGIDTKKFVKDCGGVEGLKGVLIEGQGAYFQSVISIMRDGLIRPESFIGRINGHLSIKGNFSEIEKGFPFNHFFIPEGRSEFMAEIPLEQRINYNHRMKAAHELREYVENLAEKEELMAGESFK